MDYLKKAAEHIRLADSMFRRGNYDRQMEIAREYAKLAAIEKGIAPADLEPDDLPVAL